MAPAKLAADLRISLTFVTTTVLSLLAGGLGTLSLAPYDVWPAGIVSLVLLLRLLAACSTRQAFWRGWLFGVGLFGSGTSWVYVSIHDHGHASVPLAAFLTAVFCLLLALLQGGFAALWVRLLRPVVGGTLVGFTALWVLFEWLRSWLLTGFPWLYLGYAQLDSWAAGWAPIFGVYGLSALVALTASCLVLAWRRRSRPVSLLYGVLLLTLWGGGFYLTTIEWVTPKTKTPLTVAMVQPDIPLAVKWDRNAYQAILNRYQQAIDDITDADLIIWPESALPRLYQHARGFLDPIAAKLERDNRALITGIPWKNQADNKYHNSIIALGQGSGVYHKQRLVPFGEYVPLESQLRGLIEFFDLPMSNFSRGPANQNTLSALSFQIGPYICYEIVYPDLVAKSAAKSDLLVTISNDSWFGSSIGPLQHLQMAQMRALENGRYLIRGTNTGVTAIINPKGKITVRAPQFSNTILLGQVTPMRGNTPFSAFGSLPVIAGCFLCLAIVFLRPLAIGRSSALTTRTNAPHT